MANYYEKEISVNKRAIEILTGTLVNGMSNGVFFLHHLASAMYLCTDKFTTVCTTCDYQRKRKTRRGYDWNGAPETVKALWPPNTVVCMRLAVGKLCTILRVRRQFDCSKETPMNDLVADAAAHIAGQEPWIGSGFEGALSARNAWKASCVSVRTPWSHASWFLVLEQNIGKLWRKKSQQS